MVAFICALTGNFKGFLLFTCIILVHEIGHVFMALCFKWNIEKILLLPFGALTIFNEKINRPLFEEFLIVVAGPILQIIVVYLLFNSTETISYSNTILLFNLLPIYPLDGSKILNIILNKFISFKKSHLLTIYISFFVMFFIAFKIKFNLVLMLSFVFIAFKIIEELKNHKALFNRFLLERYLYNFYFKKQKIVKSVYDMKRDYKHLFNDKGYKSEHEILRKRFDTNKKIW